MTTESLSESLPRVADALATETATFDDPEIDGPLRALMAAAERAAKAWSGSSFGHHSRVYYANFEPPPVGARFSSEWGFMPAISNPTKGDWQEYTFDEAIGTITSFAGDADLSAAEAKAARAAAVFEDRRAEVLSLLTAATLGQKDPVISKALDEASKLEPLSATQASRNFLPSGTISTRDSSAYTAGLQPAPHQTIMARVISIRHSAQVCHDLAKIARRSAEHVERLRATRTNASRQVGSRVFIGHGRSPAWRELKDFIQDRLRLEWDEFNRVPVAGITNVARLAEMLNAAGIAFLVLTAEDEQRDGTANARLNVVHEAGLFQGRLDFSKAIVVLEEGCAEFSNIQGLGQIRFPQGNIGAAFEEVRRVLEREGFLTER